MDEKEKSEMKERSEETFVSLIKDFCGYTSAHGPERIMSAKQWIRKAFWSLLFVAAITVLGMQVRTLYNKYKSRPLVTSVTLESDTVTYSNVEGRREGAVGWRYGEYRREGKGGRQRRRLEVGGLKGWEAGEIGEHYATTLNIAPSKKAPKWGRNRKCRVRESGGLDSPVPPTELLKSF